MPLILSNEFKLVRITERNQSGTSLRHQDYKLQQKWTDPLNLLPFEWRDIPIEEVTIILTDEAF